MDDNYPIGTRSEDIDGPPVSAKEDEYINRMTSKERLETCSEYLDMKDGRMEGFNGWLWDKVRKEHPEWVMEYVESLDGFWEELNEEEDYDPRDR